MTWRVAAVRSPRARRHVRPVCAPSRGRKATVTIDARPLFVARRGKSRPRHYSHSLTRICAQSTESITPHDVPFAISPARVSYTGCLSTLHPQRSRLSATHHGKIGEIHLRESAHTRRTRYIHPQPLPRHSLPRAVRRADELHRNELLPHPGRRAHGDRLQTTISKRAGE